VGRLLWTVLADLDRHCWMEEQVLTAVCRPVIHFRLLFNPCSLNPPVRTFDDSRGTTRLYAMAVRLNHASLKVDPEQASSTYLYLSVLSLSACCIMTSVAAKSSTVATSIFFHGIVDMMSIYPRWKVVAIFVLHGFVQAPTKGCIFFQLTLLAASIILGTITPCIDRPS
jgi:hypothetical protein